jgi:hypothetical protein
MCLTLNLHLRTTEVKIHLQSTNLRGQILLGFTREKEVDMVLRERLTEQGEREKEQGIRNQEDQQNSNSRKTYLKFLSKRSRTSR